MYNKIQSELNKLLHTMYTMDRVLLIFSQKTNDQLIYIRQEMPCVDLIGTKT
jgi:hypothetical protein